MSMPDFLVCSLIVNRLRDSHMLVVWEGGLYTHPYPIIHIR